MSQSPHPLPYAGPAWQGGDASAPFKNHTGGPVPTDADWFLPPPPYIGPVESAWTTLKQGVYPQPTLTRGLLVGSVAVAVLLLVSLVPLNTGWNRNATWPQAIEDVATSPGFWVIGLLAAGVAGAIAARLTRFRHTLTYVGRQGVVRYTMKGRRERPAREDGFLFAHAAEVRTAQTRHFVNGAYTGTSYRYAWSDANGRAVYTLSGKHNGRDGLPKKAGDPFLYAHAAELAWSLYLLDALAAQYDQHGFLHFNLAGGRWVRVGPGYFEFNVGGGPVRCNLDEIKTLNLNQGQFHIIHKDARWFSSKGKFHFDYKSMANAKLFLFAIQKLLGYRFT